MRFLLESKTFCPTCGSIMRERFRRSDGKAFLGCSKYPLCTGLRSCSELEWLPNKLQADYYISPSQRISLRKDVHS